MSMGEECGISGGVDISKLYNPPVLWRAKYEIAPFISLSSLTASSSTI